ncbi:MAG: carboxypeptidase-like regulatory domain-containing protein [Planctomycetota bacterium]|jgi:hypothetical protein
MTVEALVVGSAGLLGRTLLGTLGSLLIAGLTIAQSAASDPDFPLDEDPQGVITDTAGRPLAGARVELLCYRDPAGYLRALEEGMTKLPLLPAISGRDGSFVLPLTEMHRLFYGAGPGRFVLQVSKEGYLPWREPLARGLYGYLGGGRVLKQLAEVSTIEIEVEDPQPGMLYAVEEWDQGRYRRRSQIWNYLPIPADGRLRLERSLLPWPALSTQGESPRSRSRFGQLLYPGRSLPETDLLSEDASLKLSKPDHLEESSVRVEFEGEKQPGQVWGIYRSPSGKLLRFNFDSPSLPRDPILHLFLAGADGFATRAVGRRESVQLKPLPESESALVLRIVDEQGRGLRGARLRLTELLHHDWSGGTRPQRPLAELRSDADGRVRIPRSALRLVSKLTIIAPGYSGTNVIDPRSLDSGREFVLRRLEGSKVSFRVVDEQGRALPGALMFLSDRFYDLRENAGASLPSGLLRSDERGEITIGGILPGVYRYRCVAADRAPAQGRLELKENSGHQVIEIEMLAAQSLRLRCLTSNSEPVPFAALNFSLRNREGTRSLDPIWSDSAGRVWLRGIPEREQVILSSRKLFRSADDESFFADDSRVESLILDPTQPVFVRVPTGSRQLRTTLIMGSEQARGGSTSGATGSAADLPVTSYFGFVWTQSQATQVLLGIGDGPVVRVRSDDPDLVVGEDDGPVLVDRRSIVRRVELRFPGLTRDQLKSLRVQPKSPHYDGKMVSNRAGEMLEVDSAGTAWFLARDRGAYRCSVLHPDFLMTDLRVPAASVEEGGNEEPIEIRLVGGTGIFFQLELRAEDLDGHDMNLSIRKEPEGIVLYAQDFWQPPDGAKVGEVVRIPCPTALVPGEYAIDLQLGEKLNREIMLLPDKPMTIELGKD